MCDACNPRGVVLREVKCTSQPDLLKQLTKKPQIVVACMYCSSRLTFDSERVPRGGYSLDAELASPDRSGAAWVGPLSPLPRDLKRAELPQESPAVPVEEKRLTVTDELDSQVERLRELRDYVARRRPEFEDDPILLDAFDRLIARKKRSIMGAAGD